MKRILLALVVVFGTSFAALGMAASAERGHAVREASAAKHRSHRDHDRHSPRHVTVVRPAPAPRYSAPRYVQPRGYAYRNWQRGHYLPTQYRARPYVLDYRAYRLAPPPRGYHYVRVDDRAVLVAITSGLIANVVSDLFYR